MASDLTIHTLPPHENLLWRMGVLLFCLSIVPACGVVDYSINTKSFIPSASFSGISAPKSKNLGTIYVRYSDTEKPYEINARKVKGGYALQAPLYTQNENAGANAVISRTNERGYFIGITGRFEF